MDCQNILFSPQQSQKRIKKALRIFPLKVLNRILFFALYMFGARTNAIASLMEMSEESVKTTLNRIIKDGLPAFRDRRESTKEIRSAQSPPKLVNQVSVLVEEDYCEVTFGNLNHQLKIPMNHKVHLKSVLLSLSQADLLTFHAVSSVLGVTPAHCRELSGKLIKQDVPESIVDKRQGQVQDFLVDPSVKTELIQYFVAHVIAGHSTSSKVLTRIINDHKETSLSPRTIRNHIQKLGLNNIKKSLPELVQALKKSPESTG